MILSSPGQLGYKPTRIISLVPSQTELLHYLGLEEETIAITKFCIHPKQWFRNKTRIGGTKQLHINKIKELRPDLIIANKEENVKDQVDELAAEFPVWVTDVNDLPEACSMINDIGSLTRKENEAENLVSLVQHEFNLLIKEYAAAERIPAAYLIWKEPLMTIGGDTFISSMMEYAGLANVFKERKRYPVIEPADILNSGCKIVLLSSEPYPFKEKHLTGLQHYLPGIKLVLADGEMFSWYGSRLLKAPSYFIKLMREITVS